MDLKSFVHVHTKLKPYTHAYYEGITVDHFPAGRIKYPQGGSPGRPRDYTVGSACSTVSLSTINNCAVIGVAIMHVRTIASRGLINEQGFWRWTRIRWGYWRRHGSGLILSYRTRDRWPDLDRRRASRRRASRLPAWSAHVIRFWHHELCATPSTALGLSPMVHTRRTSKTKERERERERYTADWKLHVTRGQNRSVLCGLRLRLWIDWMNTFTGIRDASRASLLNVESSSVYTRDFKARLHQCLL